MESNSVSIWGWNIELYFYFVYLFPQLSKFVFVYLCTLSCFLVIFFKEKPIWNNNQIWSVMKAIILDIYSDRRRKKELVPRLTFYIYSSLLSETLNPKRYPLFFFGENEASLTISRPAKLLGSRLSTCTNDSTPREILTILDIYLIWLKLECDEYEDINVHVWSPILSLRSA